MKFVREWIVDNPWRFAFMALASFNCSLLTYWIGQQ